MTKNRILALSLLLVTASPATLPAYSQMAQTWDIQSHNQAERGTSAGTTLLLKRQTATAVSAFERACKIDPNDSAPFTMLGMALAMQGKYDEALHALQRAYSLQQSSEILNDTGWVYYLQHDYDAAIAAWNRALEMNPKLCQVYGNVGFAMVRKGAFTDADAQFRKLVKCRPNSNYGYQGIAMIHYLRGNLRQARAAAERSELTQSYAPVVLLLAKIDALQGDKVAAVKRAHQYAAMTSKRNAPDRPMTELGIPPQHDFYWDPLKADTFDNGYLLAARVQDPLNDQKRIGLAKQGNAEQAIQAAQAGLSQTPNDLFLLRELGLAQLANGSYAAATETFQKIIDAFPHCHVDLLHMARAMAFQGRGSEGAAYVTAFQTAVPNQQIAPAFLNIGKEPDPVPAATAEPVGPAAAKQEAKPARVKPEKKAKVVPQAQSPVKTKSPDVIPADDF
jgi:Flp pilus assembly protein TadD